MVFVTAPYTKVSVSYDHIDEFKKFAILKKGIGIESQNLCKQFNDQKTMQTRWNSTVAIEQKVDSKAFAIPILTALPL